MWSNTQRRTTRLAFALSPWTWFFLFLSAYTPKKILLTEVFCDNAVNSQTTVMTTMTTTEDDFDLTVAPGGTKNQSRQSENSQNKGKVIDIVKKPPTAPRSRVRNKNRINPQNARHPESERKFSEKGQNHDHFHDLYGPMSPHNFYHPAPYYAPRTAFGFSMRRPGGNFDPKLVPGASFAKAPLLNMYVRGFKGDDDSPGFYDHAPGSGDFVEAKVKTCSGDCEADEFLCVGSCTCIPNSYRCDGDPDCDGEQDELECGEPTYNVYRLCLESEDNVRCPKSGKCIKKSWLCDGDDDCGDFSDETHCDGRNCTTGEFECKNGFCIQDSWKCDGDNDCKDYSDEINCLRERACSDTELQCNNGDCISIAWKCDFEPDCPDASDEEGCPEVPHVCNGTEFECAYPRCVMKAFKCDGDNDCGDWSDEQNCTNSQFSCGPAEFKCDGGRCIPEIWTCDEEVDCENGEDEKHCSKRPKKTCGPDEYTCDNGNCILNIWVCDNMEDCVKGEDELNCIHTCHETQFNCAAHSKNSSFFRTPPDRRNPVNCIAKKHVCDGRKDCPEGEDERNCPKVIPCKEDSKCEQHCLVMPNGREGCGCDVGYEISENNETCIDIDECLFEYNPVCSQLCNNTIGSYTCVCQKGYLLRPDGKTCKAVGEAPTLIFANRIDIRQITLNNLRYVPILKSLPNAIALDYHYKRGTIFWSDVSIDVIKQIHMNGTGKADVIKWGLESPGGVAVDWIHDLLFWTDSGTRRVEVATIDGKCRHVIVSSEMDKPRAIAVHPGKALVFWTDWGPRPKIEVAEMTGENRKSIITEGVLWPNGITLDYVVDRLYWTDAKHHLIETARFDGTDRRKLVTKGVPHPFAITVFEDAIYWTDWHTKSIASVNKNTGLGFRIVHTGLHFPMDIRSYHPQRQPDFPNHCGRNKGGCSHLCLPTSNSYKCACPLGLHLHGDKKTCTDSPENFLVFARSKEVRVRTLNSGKEAGIIDIVLPLDHVRSGMALAIESDSKMIYWSDVESRRISKIFLNGTNQEVLISENLGAPTGLAVDWITKKLYWTDAGFGRIEVSYLNGSMRSLLIWEDLHEPRNLVLDPIAGYMYFAQWGENPKIQRAGMDGSNRRTMISKDLKWPNGLAIDFEKSRLYWVDGGKRAIEYSRLDGTGRSQLKIEGTDVRHPFGMALYGNTIYWTDWETNSIHYANKNTGKNASVLRDGLSNLMDIEVFHRDHKNILTPCHKNNGNCSHLCLIAPPPEKFSCACPAGIQLLSDGKNCASGPTNSLIFAHRVDIREISLDVTYFMDSVLPLPRMRNAKSVDVDRITGDIYWSDTTDDVILRASRDGKRVEKIVGNALSTVEGIVIDSTGRKIYWTDAGRASIEVCELDGTNRKVLIFTELDNPRAIALHYHRGLMFWSDWGEYPKIEQADMDGENRKVVISQDLRWPNGLAIDRPAGRLYWNDGKRKVIESSDLEGKDRKVIVRQVPHPYGLVVVGTHLYWTDWKTRCIHRADKRNGDGKEIVISDLEGLMDIRSVQVENIAENACGEDNGGCSHLCLRKPHGYACACPTGIVMQDDGKTCYEYPSVYLLFATRTNLARISFDTPGEWDVILPISEIENSISVDFHWDRSIIFYADVNLDVIRAVNMRNLTDNKPIVWRNLTTPAGLTVDWLAENIYWTDTGRQTVEVAKLDGSCRKILLDENLGEPRAIAVYPSKGYLFWSDWGELPKIERAFLDGSERFGIVTSDLGFPNGLAIDYETNRLFWVDALKDRIEVSDINGRNRIPLVVTSTHPFGLTVYGDHIFWTDWYDKSVEMADKLTGKNRIIMQNELDRVMEIKAVSTSRQSGWSPCTESNGYCTHLCFFRRKDYVCGCPDKPDGRHCDLEPRFYVPVPPEEVEEEEEKKQEDKKKILLSEVETKSDLDDILGDSSVLGGMSDDEFLTSKAIPLVVIFIAALFILILVVVIGSYKLNKRKPVKVNEGKFTDNRMFMTFFNPNYSTANNADFKPVDKKFFSWKKVRSDRAQNQERVYHIREAKRERIGSSRTRPVSPAPPPLPPKRIGLINQITNPT